MKYQLVEYETIFGEIAYSIHATDSKGTVWVIPEDESNSDYQQYLLWLEEQA